MLEKGTYHNLSGVLEMADGDKEFMTILVQTFVEVAPGLLDSMRTAYAKRDWSTMGRHAHSLKPNAKVFGLDDIYEDLLYIETCGSNGDAADDLETRISKVERVVAVAVKELQ